MGNGSFFFVLEISGEVLIWRSNHFYNTRPYIHYWVECRASVGEIYAYELGSGCDLRHDQDDIQDDGKSQSVCN